MAKDQEELKVYNIPENFIDESRIINGMFRTRGVIEGGLMALVVVAIILLFPISDFNTRVFVMVALAGPVFLVGYMGFWGEPFSVTIRNAKKWYDTRGVMLFNWNVRALIKSPLAVMMEKELPRDKLVDMIDNIKEKQKEKNAQVQYIEGETFEFEEDQELEDIYADGYYFVELDDVQQLDIADDVDDKKVKRRNKKEKKVKNKEKSARKNKKSDERSDEISEKNADDNELNLDDIFGFDDEKE